MNKSLFAILIVFVQSGCTVVGTYYLVNRSEKPVDVSISVRSKDNVFPQDSVVRIDNIGTKKLKYASFKKMSKQLVGLDTVSRQFNFMLHPGEVAYVGSGPNTSLWNVRTIEVRAENELTTIYGEQYGQFDIKRSGCFRYLGVREIK